MAVIVPTKMLFVAHPRTASTALRNALLGAGGKVVGMHHDMVEALQDFHCGEPVLSVIRNPYDVLASWWFVRTFDRANSKPLHEFIASFKDTKGNFCRNGRMFYHTPHSDIIVRYEEMPSSLDKALSRCSVEPLQLETLNVTTGKKPWRDIYYPRAVQAANERFGFEIEEHGYELLNPRQ